jgi:hypothetical protein
MDGTWVSHNISRDIKHINSISNFHLLFPSQETFYIGCLVTGIYYMANPLGIFFFSLIAAVGNSRPQKGSDIRL